ncbi:tRNA lysidine(34) synthetase TilS [Chloroflexota bacterium]
MKDSKENPLAQRILRFIRQHRLTTGGQRLIVAVSGGPDSVCLLHILLKLRQELDVELHVAHLNHRIRGADAEEDAGYTVALAQKLNLPATIAERDVPAYRKQWRLSPEEAAREVRYAFLAEVAQDCGAASVAVGHTRDDHVETVLMHLIRGSGTGGLRGLLPRQRYQASDSGLSIIRPLLEVSREETAAYCLAHQLQPRQDTSNLSLSPLRNRIRLELLPLLKGYNPKVVDALRRCASIAADETDFLDREIAKQEGEVSQRQGEVIIFQKAAFKMLPAALQRHLLRRSIEGLAGNLKDLEAKHIEDILEALGKPTGKKITLPGGLTFTIEYNGYRLGLDAEALIPLPELETEQELNIPGITRFSGWQIAATIAERKQPAEEKGVYTASFDFDRVGRIISVRRRHPGDRFQPLGMSAPKKLNEFMIDAKIPRSWRKRIPIITSPGQILWVVGYRIDERAKVTDTTRRVLHLKVERAN